MKKPSDMFHGESTHPTTAVSFSPCLILTGCLEIKYVAMPMGEAMMRCFCYEEWWSPACWSPCGVLLMSCCWCPAADASSLTPGAPSSSPHCTSACFGSSSTLPPWEAPSSPPWTRCMRDETFLQDMWVSPLDASPDCRPCFLCRLSPSETAKCLILSPFSDSPPLLFEGYFELTLPSLRELRVCDWGHGRCFRRDAPGHR